MFTTALPILLVISTQSFARISEWSLEPRVRPFPCDTVKVVPGDIVAVKPLKIFCNGGVALSVDRGFHWYDQSFICTGVEGKLLIGADAMKQHPDHLVTIIRKTCAH